MVSVIWFYTGMSPQDMADRIVANSERGITTTVNDIEHMESQSVNGLGIIKVFFRPGTNMQTAIAQVTAISQTTVRGLPPGTTPPLIISYSASTTPIIQLGLSSKTLPEQELFDLGQNFLRNFAGHGPGRGHALSLRRKDPPDPGGPGPAEAAVLQPFARSTSSTRSMRRT